MLYVGQQVDEYKTIFHSQQISFQYQKWKCHIIPLRSCWHDVSKTLTCYQSNQIPACLDERQTGDMFPTKMNLSLSVYTKHRRAQRAKQIPGQWNLLKIRLIQQSQSQKPLRTQTVMLLKNTWFEITPLTSPHLDPGQKHGLHCLHTAHTEWSLISCRQTGLQERVRAGGLVRTLRNVGLIGQMHERAEEMLLLWPQGLSSI